MADAKKKRSGGIIPKPRSGLTDLRQRFVEQYLINPNATEAYKKAGGKATGHSAESVASRMLRNVEVSAAIARAQDARAERVQVNQDYVLRNLVEIVERSMQRAPVMVREGRQLVQATDEDGRHIWTFNGKVAVAALSWVGKHLKMFTNKIEVDGDELDATLAREFARVTGSSQAPTGEGPPTDANRGSDGIRPGSPGEGPPAP